MISSQTTDAEKVYGFLCERYGAGEYDKILGMPVVSFSGKDVREKIGVDKPDLIRHLTSLREQKKIRDWTNRGLRGNYRVTLDPIYMRLSGV